MKKLLVAIIISIFSGLTSQAQDSLFKEDLIPAARLIDLNFTDSERTMMYPDLKRNLNQYRTDASNRAG